MSEIRKDGGLETVKRSRANKFIIAEIIAVIFIIVISVLFFAMDNDNNLKNEDIKKELYIRYTEDKGESWNKLNINLKESYDSENYKFNAESPIFDGLEGTYPIKAAYWEENNPIKEKTVNLESKDGGKTWNWQVDE